MGGGGPCRALDSSVRNRGEKTRIDCTGRGEVCRNEIKDYPAKHPNNCFNRSPVRTVRTDGPYGRSVRTVRTDRPYANEKMRRPMKVRRPEVRNRNFYHLVDCRPLLMARPHVFKTRNLVFSYFRPCSIFYENPTSIASIVPLCR